MSLKKGNISIAALGSRGENGFSPIANVSKTGDTATITITDKEGTTTASVTDGAAYELPIADSDTLGGIKVGENLSITNGVLSASSSPITIPEIALNGGQRYTFTEVSSMGITSHGIYKFVSSNEYNYIALRYYDSTNDTVKSTTIYLPFLYVTLSNDGGTLIDKQNLCYFSPGYAGGVLVKHQIRYMVDRFGDYDKVNNYSNALATNNTVTYTPTGDYNPATKKYVDDLAGSPIITALSGTEITLVSDSVNSLSISANTTFTLPTMTDGKFHQILIFVNYTSGSITWGTNYFFNAETPTIEVGNYNFIFEYDGTNWYAGAMNKGSGA